jgi:hypothetical protein
MIQGQRLPRHYVGPHLPIAPPSTPTRSQPRVTMPIRPIAAGVREFHYGKFYRALRLPSGTNVSNLWYRSRRVKESYGKYSGGQKEYPVVA